MADYKTAPQSDISIVGPTDLASEFSTISLDKEYFLSEADDLSRITIPSLAPRGNRVNKQPFTDAGGLGVKTLAATVRNLLFPNNASWFRSVFSPKITSKLPGNIVEKLDDFLAGVDKNIIGQMQIAKLDAVVDTLLVRLFVEGQIAVNIYSSDEIRIFPFRNFVVCRENGKPTKLCLREKISGEGANCKYLYTYVDFVHNKCYQQSEINESPTVIDADVSQYFVVSTEIPLVEDYVLGYAHQYYGTINALNEYERSLIALGNIAGFNLLQISTDAGVSAKKIQEILIDPTRISTIEVATMGAIQWMSAGIKLNDFRLLLEVIQEKGATLKAAFAAQLFGQSGGAKTATEIRQLIAELDSLTSSLSSTLAMTLQIPLVKAFTKVMGTQDLITTFIKSILPDAPKEALEVALIAGVSALSRDAAIEKLINVLVTVAKIKPELLQTIDSKKLFMIMANQLQLSSTNIFTDLSPQHQALIAAIQQMPIEMVQGIIQSLQKPQLTQNVAAQQAAASQASIPKGAPAPQAQGQASQ